MRKLLFGPLFAGILLVFGMNGVVAATTLDPSVTPGATSPSATQEALCSRTVSAPKLTNVVKAHVFAEYHVTKKARNGYVVDRLVPVSLGGTNDGSNLWPLLRSAAAAKSAAESYAHDQLCAKKVDLASAQQAFATDWTTAQQVVREKVAATDAALARYAQALKQAEQQKALQDYLASLPPPTQAPQVGCPNGTYVNSAGNTVCSPYSSPSGPPAGATAQCRDGTYSFSQSRSGTCSSHGGVAQWL